MGFNEFNTVENYIIYQLTGLNLNSGAQEPKEKYGLAWEYQPASSLNRSVNEVLLEPELMKHLKIPVISGDLGNYLVI